MKKSIIILLIILSGCSQDILPEASDEQLIQEYEKIIPQLQTVDIKFVDETCKLEELCKKLSEKIYNKTKIPLRFIIEPTFNSSLDKLNWYGSPADEFIDALPAMASYKNHPFGIYIISKDKLLITDKTRAETKHLLDLNKVIKDIRIKKEIQEDEKFLSECPKTISEAVERIISSLAKEDLQNIRNSKEKDLILFHHGLGMSIRNKFGLWRGNHSLMKETGANHPDDASGVIIHKLWERLQSDAPNKAVIPTPTR